MGSPTQNPDEPDLPRPVDRDSLGEVVEQLLQRIRDLAPTARRGSVAFATAVLVALGLIAWAYSQRDPIGVPLEAQLPMVQQPTPSVAATTPTVTSLLVHVAGAVTRPGVYELESSARVTDAVDAAGGPTSTANLGAINLAAPVQDGSQVYVPEPGEAIPYPSQTSSGDVSAGASVVNLNSASPTELESLPGVGPATAGAIIAYREEHGAFGSVSSLLNVPGIGPAKLAAIRDLVAIS